MGYSHLLALGATLANFREAYGVPGDVDIAYYQEGDIALEKGFGPNVAFFPLMAILKGGVRFPVDLFIICTLRFYGLCSDQVPPNFYRVVSCISRLNQIYGLQLNHYNINFMYSLYGNIKSNYYLKVRDLWIRLISCLLNSNRNLVGEFVRVSGNWLADEHPCLLSLRDVGQYRVPFSILNLILSLILLA